MVYNYVRDNSSKILLLERAVLWSAFLVALLGILQYVTDVTVFQPLRVDVEAWNQVTVSPFVMPDITSVSDSGIILRRIGAVYVGSPNLEANFLILGFFTSLTGLMFSSKNRLLYIFAFFSISVAMILTHSRGAWLGVSVSLLLLFLSAYKAKRFKSTLTLLFIGVLFVPFSVLIFARLAGWQYETSTLSHTTMWESAFLAAKESPIFGKGLGAFKIGDTVYEYALKTSGNAYMLQDLATRRNVLIHNYYLQTWAETGLMGLFSLLGLIWIYVKRTWGYAIHDMGSSMEKQCCLSFLLSSIAMMVQNLTINQFGVELWVPIAISVGLVAAKGKQNV